MGLSVRLAFSGLLALSVGGVAGWLYSADPADVAQTSAKLLKAVASIVRLPTRDAPTQEGMRQPSIEPLPRAAAPSPKSPALVTQPGKAAEPPAKPQARPTADPSPNPEKKKPAAKTRQRPPRDDD
jgi:hypothetical protein